MSPSTRASVANRTRYKVFLDKDTFAGVVADYISETKYTKKDKLDRAVIAKIAHWDNSYIKSISAIPDEFNHIKAQFVLITLITAVEAAIGMPKYGSHDRIFKFFDNNLEAKDKLKFTEGIKFFNKTSNKFETRSLIDTVKQLILRRNGLMHRAELINLIAENGIIGVGTRGHSRNGQIAYFLDISLSVDDVAGYVRKALINYFDKHWTKRIPQQDYGIKKK